MNFAFELSVTFSSHWALQFQAACSALCARREPNLELIAEFKLNRLEVLTLWTVSELLQLPEPFRELRIPGVSIVVRLLVHQRFHSR